MGFVNDYNRLKMERDVMRLPCKAEADAKWRNLANCDIANRANAELEWYGKMQLPSSGASCNSTLAAAISSLAAMGYKTEQAESLFKIGLEKMHSGDYAQACALSAQIYIELARAEKDADHPYNSFAQYTVWEDYDQAIADWPVPARISRQTYADKTRGGWLAQIAAGTAASQVEGYSYHKILESGYSSFQEYLTEPCLFNDDIAYEIVFIKLFAQLGYAMTSEELALRWIELLPFGMSAEGVAMRNLKMGIAPPESGRFHNCFREWIGAQMRSSICGMVAPGDPRTAARLAWIDGCISHANNGILGGVFNAVMASLAYILNDARQIVERALTLLPSKSEYYTVIRSAIEVCKSADSWREAWETLLAKYQDYSWVHAYPNAAAEVVALWFGENDFDKTLEIICLAGYDTDSSAGPALSVIGILNGPDCVDSRWTIPLNGKVDTYIRGFETIRIDELVQETIDATFKHFPKKRFLN